MYAMIRGQERLWTHAGLNEGGCIRIMQQQTDHPSYGVINIDHAQNDSDHYE